MALCQFALAAPFKVPTHIRRPVTSCNLSTVSHPASNLTAPTSDMKLVLIALGQGTQNYTCASSTSVPAAIGALAQLYNASCAVASNPSASTDSLASIAASSATIGTHFFVDNTTPDFDIQGLGNTEVKKAEDAAAPNPSADVKWLRLQAQATGTTSSVKQIYRLRTVGGVAPATCEGRTAGEVITVDYQAQYWVYA